MLSWWLHLVPGLHWHCPFIPRPFLTITQENGSSLRTPSIHQLPPNWNHLTISNPNLTPTLSKTTLKELSYFSYLASNQPCLHSKRKMRLAFSICVIETLLLDARPMKLCHLPSSHHKNTNNRKDQGDQQPQKTTSPVKMFHNENYLEDPQNAEFKRTIFKMIKNLCNLKRSQKHEWT